ncbi:M35 family metallo-endopeptidase [Burkholderia sp. LMG 32019]|uniref:M35 family metallo-endopeptidase n=1 Tax=Burkholderia sp. LMG 32019 TaxID=3158173 RepID=UPI003C2AFA74
MSDFSKQNEYGFKTEENEEWFLVHSGAVTNTNPGSMVEVKIDTTPICKNMKDSEFRKLVLSLRDDAVKVIHQRIGELNAWQPPAQERVKTWFGTADETTRQTLMAGLAALIKIMNDLTGVNFVRPNSYMDKATGCLPNRKNLDGEMAHVCGPDTATHTIAIDEGFCTLPDKSAATLSSKQLTIVHECTHFLDTFGSVDYNNNYGQFLGKLLAKNEPSMAIKNADNIAWHILSI